MNKKLLKDSLGWGSVLWLIGYALGIAFSFVLPTAIMGWFIMPIGILIAFWVLMKKVKGNFPAYYFVLAVVWTLMAIALDYLLIVKAFNPPDGYYKLDVYLYYALIFIMPPAVGWWKTAQSGATN